ncbi:MAG: Na+/H+ antiporter subunit E [Acetomicrobium sp.]|mgnify:FL=1|jgi:multicomponent Na+:H+ antiporter subunit E|uniref:Na+/H+ antiporter subunit E n=1 Tax=Acetomicrobium sp. TaxID=1872099 RepID=UPI002B2604A0|nr:Na+/H+ antiporter subunit E [Acetomicrobium sp.]HOB10397.1 Na+/H+ antiporter subunit E [Acetomicrobium sp.]HOM97550.1 Na+/H+ antiporter subunit E [Acetomicrobium sp.]HQC87822.1 Na+/H+ antiporter subunit E [Acetomicrobium sp.]HXK99640.1 Na+/H+ antiporter subunit E [Acetomicrobium sp.]
MVIFIASVVMYLLFVWSGGMIPLSEVVIAIILGAIITYACRSWSPGLYRMTALRPDRWIKLIAFIFGPFLWGMTKANLDVAYRVITGKINPGIVRVQTSLRNAYAITMLANSITLTPGTLTVDVDEDNGTYYIHWINITNIEPSGRDVYGPFEDWAKKVVEL